MTFLDTRTFNYPLFISEIPHLYFDPVKLPPQNDDDEDGPFDCATDPEVQSGAAKMSSRMYSCGYSVTNQH
ncbi:MAG TPA: hypothetical protein VGO47_11795 [Chlamydiales bacterium]|nr:hypothetical protein [Chlamydiales bacterium]